MLNNSWDCTLRVWKPSNNEKHREDEKDDNDFSMKVTRVSKCYVSSKSEREGCWILDKVFPTTTTLLNEIYIAIYFENWIVELHVLYALNTHVKFCVN